MSVDENQENLFQMLAAHTTRTEDEILEFARAVEKKYADKGEVFSHLAAPWLGGQKTNWQCPWCQRIFLYDKK